MGRTGHGQPRGWRRRRDSGLSLIEVLVAVAIVATVFVPVFRMFLAGVEATKYTEDRLRAFAIAKRQIETLRHAATINRASSEQVVKGWAGGPGFAPYLVDNRYRVQTTVDPEFKVTENGHEAVVIYVRVQISWEVAKTNRELELETYIDRAYN